MIPGKYELLKKRLKELGSVAVALTGGVNSCFLLKIAVEVLGHNVLAISLNSSIYIDEDLASPTLAVRKLGVLHIAEDFDHFTISGFKQNPSNRCYHCKKAFFSKIKDIAVAKGFSTVIDGSDLDDLREFPSAFKAFKELRIINPFVEVGLNKNEIQLVAKDTGCSCFDVPIQSCLATRFPYGVKITESTLKTVRKAEDFLKHLGFENTRARYNGDAVRIEVAPDDMELILQKKSEIVSGMKKLGFIYVSLDLQGYRLNSAAEALN
jgi:pyridinium-3,5-biscarboxylic acid mononucleotide sulfurtransferase